MTLLVARRAGLSHLPSRPASIHLVPEGGVLLFPGVARKVAPPAQLGPLMSPPRGTAGLFGR